MHNIARLHGITAILTLILIYILTTESLHKKNSFKIHSVANLINRDFKFIIMANKSKFK